MRKYAARIPKQAEGYYLKIDKEGIVVAGADRRGVFYGVQTLVQLIALPKLPLVEVTDYPDVPSVVWWKVSMAFPGAGKHACRSLISMAATR